MEVSERLAAFGDGPFVVLLDDDSVTKRRWRHRWGTADDVGAPLDLAAEPLEWVVDQIDGLGEDRADGGGDHVGVGLGDLAQHVAHEVNVWPWRPDYQLRFFRNDNTIVRFPKVLHEPAEVLGLARYLTEPIYHRMLVISGFEERQDEVVRYEGLRPGAPATPRRR